MGHDQSKLLPYLPQSLAAAALVNLVVPPRPGTRWRMRLLRSYIVLTISVPLSVGCSTKMSVFTVGGIRKAATSTFKVTALSKMVTAPGEVLTLTGRGFRSTLSLAKMSGSNLADASGAAVNAKLEVQGGDKATVTLPSSMSFGKYSLTLTQDGESQQITLFSNGGKTDYPIITAGADKVCSGEKFYDETGTLREGTRVCNLPLPECSEDGAKACTATAAYSAAATNGLADKVVSGQSVAGIAGNFTSPNPTKVHVNNGPFGVAGTSLTPTLADCASDGGINCVAVAAYPAAKLANFSNVDIRSGVTVAGVAGALSGAPSACASDGAVGCLSTSTYAAALRTNLAPKILTGNTVAGVPGSAIAESHINCATDGATGCVAVTNYAAAATNGLASKVLSGSTVAGVTGNVTLPTAANVYSGIQFGVNGTGLTGALTLPAPGNVRALAGAFGINGTSVTPTLPDCSADGGIGCVTVGPNYASALTTGLAPKVVSGNTVAGIAGSATAESHSNCSADGATGCISVANYTAAAMNGLASKVLSTSTVAGIAGNVTLPAQGKVYTGIQYGVSGTALTGTLTIPLASNVMAGSPAYGDPGASVSPTFNTSSIYVRPGAPTITATAFNFSPDRITLTWNAVSNASGYLVLMNKSTPVTWTPTDFTTYSVGTAGSDTIAYVGSSTNPTINTTITAGTTFYFAIYTYQANQVYSSTSTTKTVLSCAGLAGGTWVAVPGDSVYGTNGFCVQKYIPSNVSNVPTSQTGTTPWVRISQTTAKTQCSNLGAGYHLITNPEWMTIAANIANTGSNWSGGSVGSGTLARGHSDNNPASACAAAASDANGWVQNDCTGQTQGALAYIERRTRDLSNGNVIWDIGGNVGQWVDYNNVNDKPTPATAAWYEYTAITGSTATPRTHLVPVNSVQNWWSDSWNSSQSIGQIYPSTNGAGGALFRGAYWNDAANAGPFAFALLYVSSDPITNIGFRCAWQP